MVWKNKCNFACFTALLMIYCYTIPVYALENKLFPELSKINRIESFKLNKELKTILNISNEYSATSYPMVTEAERRVIGSTFENEDIYLRLERLEKKLFSSVFSKDELSDRVDRIREKTQTATNETQDKYFQQDEDIYQSELPKDNILDKLFDTEINVLGSSFEDESPEERLAKLEKVIFGYKQNGTIQSRINQAYEISKTSFNRYNSGTNQNKADYESYNPPKTNAISPPSSMANQFSYSDEQRQAEQNYNAPQSKVYFQQNDLSSSNSLYPYGNSVQSQSSGIVDTLKQIAYPFALYFLSKSSAGNYVPNDLINQFFGSSNNNNYQSMSPNYQTYPGSQYAQQNQYNYGGGARVLPY